MRLGGWNRLIAFTILNTGFSSAGDELFVDYGYPVKRTEDLDLSFKWYYDLQEEHERKEKEIKEAKAAAEREKQAKLARRKKKKRGKEKSQSIP